LKTFYELCDNLRNQVLPKLNITLEDRQNLPTLWKYEDSMSKKEETSKEEELKKSEGKDKLQNEKKDNKKVKEIDDAKYDFSAKEWYAQQKDKYSAFDEKGIPTHNTKGEELPKKR